MPAELRLFCSKNGTCEDQVGNIYDEKPRTHEDLCRYCESKVILSGCPCNAENESTHFGHTKSVQQG
jgi:hypothetical protein